MAQPRNTKCTPGKQELQKLARRLISEQTTMTLATAEYNQAWSAPVYYVFFKSGFYFLSDPTSRHIQQALASGQASSAVHAFASTWREIRGLQMSGRIQLVQGGLEAVQVLREYLKKYPFTQDFFGTPAPLDLDGFGKRFGVKLYKFVPSLVYYLDNQIRFAFRAEVML